MILCLDALQWPTTGLLILRLLPPPFKLLLWSLIILLAVRLLFLIFTNQSLVYRKAPFKRCLTMAVRNVLTISPQEFVIVITPYVPLKNQINPLVPFVCTKNQPVGATIERTNSRHNWQCYGSFKRSNRQANLSQYLIEWVPVQLEQREQIAAIFDFQ